MSELASAKESAAALCTLCPHRCRLQEGAVGFCRARANRGGSIRSLSYGKLAAAALDPIEKKPLYRFRPRSKILSIGTFGCNLRCPFCQNHAISQAGERGGIGALPLEEATPQAVVRAAARLAREAGNIGVAFTYNEPLVGYEFVYDTARLLKAANLAVVLVTNGQIAREPWERLLPFVDAVNIDLKGFTQAFYDWVCGDLMATKEAILLAAAHGVHVEVTTLVIPTKNDSSEEMEAEAAWLASISPEIPLHLTRYFPRYQTHIKTTPLETLWRMEQAARDYLRHVYLGNV